MASWMIHLRVADLLTDRIPGLDKTAFVVGNIAPDSLAIRREGNAPGLKGADRL